MIRTVLTDSKTNAPLWIDVTSPTHDDLLELAQKYNFPETMIEDVMEHRHLPKHEDYGDITFMLFRAYDDYTSKEADSIHSMTVKIALFLGNRILITVHRDSQKFIKRIEHKYTYLDEPVYVQVLMLDLIEAAIETLTPELETMELEIEDYETALLEGRIDTNDWKDIFRIKSRLASTKRVLWHSLQAAPKFSPKYAENQTLSQNIREKIENLLVYNDSIIEDLNSILHIQLSLSSNATNDVMRVLTLFSVFFLPLSFIVGIYGMNFEHMPILKWKHGYYFIWAVMIGVVAFIYIWFKRKKWI